VAAAVAPPEQEENKGFGGKAAKTGKGPEATGAAGRVKCRSRFVLAACVRAFAPSPDAARGLRVPSRAHRAGPRVERASAFALLPAQVRRPPVTHRREA
jgi:hypothetical protein